jgi:hypothetical protein
MACSASANLDLAIPNWVEPVKDPTADNAANQGTKWHEYFATLMLLSGKNIEHFAAALAYVATIKQTRRFQMLIEQEMTADWLASKPTSTADLVLYTADELHVFDLKTGKIRVEVIRNAQLMFYALTYMAFAPKAKGVTLHIVQPWADNIEAWYVSAADLQDFMRDAIAAEKKIKLGDTTFMPGDHCTFCPANPHARGEKGHPYCPAMMGLLYPEIIDEDALLTMEDFA